MVNLGLIQSGALPGTTISLTNLLNSDLVNVSLEDLMKYDLLSESNLLGSLRVNFDRLIESRLISFNDLVALGVPLPLYDTDSGSPVLVENPADAELIDLSFLLNLEQFNLLDIAGMGFLAESEFDLTGTILNIANLETAGIIADGALDSLAVPTISLGDLLNSTLVSVTLADLLEEEIIGRTDLLDLTSVLAGNLGLDGFDLYDLIDLGFLSQNDATSFAFDIFNIQDLPIDLGFDLGGVLEMGTTATADIVVSIEGGLEWIIDFNGLMEEEGITFLINNAHISGRASLDVNDLAFFAKLGFINITAGGVGTNSGIHLLAEATLTLDEDGNIATTNDRQFSLMT